MEERTWGPLWSVRAKIAGPLREMPQRQGTLHMEPSIQDTPGPVSLLEPMLMYQGKSGGN
jgi:hypothetical protein